MSLFHLFSPTPVRSVHHNKPFNSRTPRVIGSDRIALVVFNDDAKPLALPADPFAPRLQERLQQLPSMVCGNYTNIAAGLALSVQMLERTPPGILRRTWLLSDGLPNRNNDRIRPALESARRSRININTIQFGDRGNANAQLLRDIARATHNGKFYQIDNLRDLKRALIFGHPSPGRTHRQHQSETTVFCIDTSGSMVGPMEGKRKIDAVVEALITLLEYKQKTWS